MEIKIDSFIDSITIIPFIAEILSFTKNRLSRHRDSQTHMFQLSRYEREAFVLKGQLLPSLFFLKCIVMRLFWLKRQIFFQVDHTFYKLDMKILAASNEIRCVRCSRHSL